MTMHAWVKIIGCHKNGVITVSASKPAKCSTEAKNCHQCACHLLTKVIPRKTNVYQLTLNTKEPLQLEQYIELSIDVGVILHLALIAYLYPLIAMIGVAIASYRLDITENWLILNTLLGMIGGFLLAHYHFLFRPIDLNKQIRVIQILPPIK